MDGIVIDCTMFAYLVILRKPYLKPETSNLLTCILNTLRLNYYVPEQFSSAPSPESIIFVDICEGECPINSFFSGAAAIKK